MCIGTNDSIILTIPYELRGIINLYVYSWSSEYCNIGSIRIDSR